MEQETNVVVYTPWYAKLILFSFGLISCAVACIGLFGLGVFSYYAKDIPHPDVLFERQLAESSKIYDRSGEVLLYEVHNGEKRSVLDEDEIPDLVKAATIAVEDNRFYEHKGVDVTAIARAAVTNYLRPGQLHGGSTITQQLVKNTVFSSEQTYDRKIREALFSVQLERMATKDEILHRYLNEIFYGRNSYGIAAAADTYFDKKVDELTVSEVAFLVSLPKAPSQFSPYRDDRSELDARHQWAIDQLAEVGAISGQEQELAHEQELAFANPTDAGIIAPHFVFAVLDQLEDTYTKEYLETAGLRIITTLDYDRQLKAERAVDAHIDRVRGFGATNAALAAIEPSSGEVLALVGSNDYFNESADGNVNVATSLRQPGSSFKPYVYAAAFEAGIGPDSVVLDSETDFGGGYKPVNYDGQTRGAVTLKQALTSSLNIPAVKLGVAIGPDRVVELARRLGIDHGLEEDDYFGPSSALGAKEVPLLDHVAAMSVFANRGVKPGKTLLRRIETRSGEVVAERAVNEERVVSEAVADTLNSVLSDNNLRAGTFGSNSALNLSRPNAAKTGTTNDFKDAWTIGYTPNLAVGVWVGNNSGQTMRGGAAGIFVAAPLWHDFMEDALLGLPVEGFAVPSGGPSTARDPRSVGQCGSFPELCAWSGVRAQTI